MIALDFIFCLRTSWDINDWKSYYLDEQDELLSRAERSGIDAVITFVSFVLMTLVLPWIVRYANVWILLISVISLYYVVRYFISKKYIGKYELLNQNMSKKWISLNRNFYILIFIIGLPLSILLSVLIMKVIQNLF